MFCPYCGKPSPEGGVFCEQCGKRLSDMTPPVASQPPAAGWEVVVPEAVGAEVDGVAEAAEMDTGAFEPPMPVLPELPEMPPVSGAAVEPDGEISAGWVLPPEADVIVEPEAALPLPETPYMPPQEQAAETAWAASATFEKKGLPAAVRVLLSLLVCMMLFGSVAGLTACVVARVAVTREAAVTWAREVDWGKLPVSGVRVERQGAVVELEDDTLGGYMCTLLYPELVEKWGLTPGKVDSILSQSPSVERFMAEKAGAYIDAAMDGGKMACITEEELVALARENRELIRETTGYEMTEEDYEALLANLRAYDLTAKTDFDRIMNGADGRRYLVTAGSLWSVGLTAAMVALGALSLLYIFLLLLIHSWRGRSVLAWAGGTVALVGGALGGGAAALRLAAIPAMLREPSGAAFLQRPMETLSVQLLWVGLPVLLAGLLMIAVAVLLRAASRRKAAET